jgi:hypothetical protein
MLCKPLDESSHCFGVTSRARILLTYRQAWQVNITFFNVNNQHPSTKAFTGRRGFAGGQEQPSWFLSSSQGPV